MPDSHSDSPARRAQGATLPELHAAVDALLPPERYLALNTLLKADPLNFSVPTRVKLPRETHKALSNLAGRLYQAAQIR